MKILSFAIQFPNAVEPGSGINIKNLMLAMNKTANIKRTVIAPVPHCPRLRKITDRYQAYERLDESYMVDDIEIHHPRYVDYPYEFLNNEIKSIIKSIDENDLACQSSSFDLIEAQSLYPDALIAHHYAEKYNKPLLLTARGDDVHFWMDIKKHRDKIFSAIDYASKLICISGCLKDELTHHGISDNKLSIIPNGLDQDTFNLNVEANPLREKYYLSVGELSISKGQHVILDAFASLLKKRLIIVGDGEQRRALKQRAKDLGIAGRVQFIKYLDQSKLAEFYKGATATIHMSDMESMPSVINEALACGSPIITTNVGDIADIINDENGFLLDAQDDYLLVRAVEKLKHKDYDQNTIAKSSMTNNWQDTAQSNINIINEILS
ncbi:glycosyltransferase [Pseudemcibacter aquimaris]|uniref:glycosyltransferase n=1 Tax=Pseudemcibacter aquimaris TaxID=2857064 RepID=UPI0020137878|nr:glycosyltransferase [Pseudemcibacter aquimaris]MCC3860229.1 glycosyltransferase [Pseudemcibacter aquimaris]WDU57554.1 glycosyltransferase [Pseudemcibacter aquimaris]